MKLYKINNTIISVDIVEHKHNNTRSVSGSWLGFLGRVDSITKKKIHLAITKFCDDNKIKTSSIKHSIYGIYEAEIIE